MKSVFLLSTPAASLALARVLSALFSRRTRTSLPVAVLCVISLQALALPSIVRAGEVMVKEETLVSAPAEAVWGFIGGFKSLDRWHPAIASSTLLGTGEEIGDIRVLTLNDGKQIVEKLESYDGQVMVLRYQILESPLPVANYHASVRVKSAEAGMALVTWESSFEAAGVSDEEAKKTISEIYLPGFESLTKLFK